MNGRSFIALGAIAVTIGVPGALWAQTSAYQSADGNTSIFLDNAKASLIFNVSDTRFTLGYLHEGSGRSLMYGFEATGKPSSNLTTQVFQKGGSPPALGGSASFGIHSPFAGAILHQSPSRHLRDDWALLHFTYTRSTFSTVANSSTEPQKQHFDGYRLLPVYDALINAPGAGLLLGVAAGIERTNNVAQLKAAAIVTPSLQSAAGISPFEAAQQTSGYVGIYKNLIGAPIYTDAIWIPKALPWIDFDLFTRSNAAHTDRYIEGGVGIFLAQPDNPTKVLGGFSLAWNNGTPTLGFVAGWAF